MSEQVRKLPEVRVGSSPDGLTPISVVEKRLGAGPVQWLSFGAVALCAFGADQLTKWLVSSRLALGSSVTVAGPLKISHVQNSGIAFGFFSQATSMVIVLTSAVVLWMVFFFARSGARHPLLPAALGLVIGGSVSNLLDRVTSGHVTDFIDFNFWPSFNLADSFIVLGVAALAFFLIAPDRYLPRSTGESHKAPGR
ncbi:MAG: signal peptidase II [Gaiellaceae bacterium]